MTTSLVDRRKRVTKRWRWTVAAAFPGDIIQRLGQYAKLEGG
jgi:hypothetical protein